MRWLSKQISPIKGRKTTGGKKTKGSIVLEASLVMPVFVMFVFFLIYIVQMTITLGQMHTLSSNAVKLVSAHMYPISLAVDSHGKSSESKSTSWTMPKLSLEEWGNEYASKFPEPLAGWMKDAINKGITPLQEMKTSVAEAVLDPVVKPLLKPLISGTGLKEERLHVSSLVIPSFSKGKQPYVGIELSYELPIKIPFTSEKIVLQTKSVERAWIGDRGQGEGEHSGASGEEEKGKAATVLAKPEPAYTGRKTKVRVKVEPGTKATLTIYYKSGASTAKYLGEATADANGQIEWEWLVGGNTTPNSAASLVVETEDGARTVDTFRVASSSEG